MSTADMGVDGVPDLTSSPGREWFEQALQPPFHRLKEVRREQGCSSRRAAQLLGTDVATVRHEEEETTDLTISRLRQWQRVLDVPLADLLVEPAATLSGPVLERARLVRLMKTAVAIHDRAESGSQKRLALTLINQLKELMPELEGVTGWTNLNPRRGLRSEPRVYEDFDQSGRWRKR